VRTLAAVLAASALGGSARYAIGLAWGRRVDGFPWATLAVNVGGAFALGLLVGLFTGRVDPPPWLQAALTVGLLGSFTTFSTWTLDSVRLAERGLGGLALLNLAAALVAGLAATVAGLALGRAL
jgi:fluoride exporter